MSISLFIYDRQFYNKESRSKLYPASAYYLANTLLEVLVNAFTGFLFGIIVYYFAGYGTEDPVARGPAAVHLIKYLGLIMLISNVGCLQSIMFSLLAPNTDIAFVLNCGYVTVSLLTRCDEATDERSEGMIEPAFESPISRSPPLTRPVSLVCTAASWCPPRPWRPTVSCWLV